VCDVIYSVWCVQRWLTFEPISGFRTSSLYILPGVNTSLLHILCGVCSGGSQSSQSVDCVLHINREPSRAAALHITTERRLCLRPGRLRHAVQSPHVHWHSWTTGRGCAARALCHAGGIRASRRTVGRHSWHGKCETSQRGSWEWITFIAKILLLQRNQHFYL